MKRTLVLCVSWKGPTPPTAQALSALKDLGASVIEYVGVTDVSLARSKGLARALQTCDENPSAFDVLLLLDDDVVPTAEHAQALVDACRRFGEPVSGIYGTKDGVVAATFRAGQPRAHRWLVGLGFFALPPARLRELAATVPHLRHHGETFPAFCRTGLHPHEPLEWTSEDYWLCRELGGGVRLEPIPASHYKPKRIDGKWVPFMITVPGRTLEAVERANQEAEKGG